MTSPRTFDEWWRVLPPGDEVTHCGSRESHTSHAHPISPDEGCSYDVLCVGTPMFPATERFFNDAELARRATETEEGSNVSHIDYDQIARAYADGHAAGRTLHLETRTHRDVILDEVSTERDRQLQKWGEQHRPDHHVADSSAVARTLTDRYRDVTDERERDGVADWAVILLEEVWEALAEEDPVKMRAELIQAAAVIVAWVEDVDSRGWVVESASEKPDESERSE